MFKALSIFIFSLCSSLTSGQVSQQIQNGVQGNPTGWRVLHSDHFNIHFSPEQIGLAKYVLPIMVNDLEFIEDRIGYRLSGRIDVFLYPSLAHYLRSSHHLNNSDLTSIDGGIIQVRGFDLPLFFDGNKANLLRELRIGIGRNLITEMLYGGTVQERIKYHTLLNLPMWFEKGLARYLAHDWDVDTDNQLRDLFLNKELDNFQLLTESQQIAVGQSLWRYIDQRKGDLSIPRILYLVRMTRKLETAFYFVFNESPKEIYDDWFRQHIALYEQEYKRRIPSDGEPIAWNIMQNDISQVHLSPNSETIIYVAQEPGLYELRSWPRMGRPEKVIYSASTPVLEDLNTERALISLWDSDGDIWLVDNTKLSLNLRKLSISGELINEFELPFQAVHSIAKTSENEMVLSGSMNGQTDLFAFNLLTESTFALTQDQNDQLDLSSDANGNFYFTSTIYNENYGATSQFCQSDLFYCIRGFSEETTFVNVTESNEINETMPIKIGKRDISFLSDKNGIRNAYWTGLEREVYPLTNYRFGIVEHRVSADKGHVIELLKFNGVYRVFISELEGNEPEVLNELALTKSFEKLRTEREQQKSVEVTIESSNQSNSATKGKIYYQSDFDIPVNIDSMESQGDQNFEIWSELGNHLGYKFKVNKLYSQIDNSYFGSDQFPTYLGAAEQLVNKFGIVLGVGLSDQRKRHHITGLMRSTLNFNQLYFRMNYRFVGENRKREVDIWRRSQFLRSGETYLRNRAFSVSAAQTWHLTDRLSIESKLRLRKDLMLPLSTSSEALQLNENKIEVWTGEGNLSWTKFRRSGLLKRGYSVDFNPKLNVSSDGLVGGEIEASVSVDRQIGKIGHYNSRMNIAFGLGQVQTLFIMGGTMNEWGAKFNFDNQIYDRNSYYFKPLFGMRGFPRNARNGNSNFLMNQDLEISLSKILPSKAIGNFWLNNTSITSFVDIGSAWYGPNPWSKDNPINSQRITDGLLDILVYNVKNPFIYSTGIGFKTSIYNYTLRYDLAWGFDNGVWNKAVSHISLGLPLRRNR